MTFIPRRLWAALAVAMLMSLLPSALARAVTPDDYDPNNPGLLDNDHLYAESAFLFDMDTGEILLSKNSRVRMYPASTTKIMTALLALESGIGLDDTVTIPVQFSGKVREKLDLPAGLDKDALLAAVMENENVKKRLEGKTIIKTIVVPGKLVNLVVK